MEEERKMEELVVSDVTVCSILELVGMIAIAPVLVGWGITEVSDVGTKGLSLTVQTIHTK